MERKRITKLYDNCNKCGLPEITCICTEIKKIKTKAKFIILSSEREMYRNTNTAQLLKLINPDSTEVVIWQRGKISKEIIEYIKNERYDVFLVFPIISEELNKRRAKFKETNKVPVFIIIDGTWGEAIKIIKKSEYLNSIPVLSLEVKGSSKFSLRRGQDEGNLCTIETAMELLKCNGELIESKAIDECFDLFLKGYKAGASGHEIKK